MASRPLSLASYAFHIRKKVLMQNSTLWHKSLLETYRTNIQKIPYHRLQRKEYFAFRFLQALTQKITNTSNFSAYSQDKGKGVFQDLNVYLQNIAAIWFPSVDNLPIVYWSNYFSYTKLGHYNTKENQIVISLIFDSPFVTTDILYYLVYHELLHKIIGIQKRNGKRYAHTTAFRWEEKRFPNYTQMEKLIVNYIST